MNHMTINGEKWIVSLSDGTTYDEEQLSDEPRRISPWSKLIQEVLPQRKAHITQLRVQVLGRTYSSIGKSERSRFPSSIKPVGYLCLRRSIADGLNPGGGRGREDYIGMEVTMSNRTKTTTWIDIRSGDSWQQIRTI